MIETKPNIILIGGGGHCKAVIEVIESAGEYTIAGIIDKKEKVGTSILGYKIIGTDDDLQALVKKYYNFCITVGMVKTGILRQELFDTLKSLDANFPVIKAASATVSKHAKIGEGTVIMHHAVINADAVIGKNNIINSAALIEHDARIGDHCHISTRATVNGEAVIEDHCMIGSGATVLQCLRVRKACIIGAGALLTKDTNAGELLTGVPAKSR